MALAAAWLGPEGDRPEAATLRKVLSAACGHSEEAVRAAGTSAIPAVMASVSRLSASGLSQVRPFLQSQMVSRTISVKYL